MGSGVPRWSAPSLRCSVGGCGDVAREGTGSAFLIVDALEAAPGAEPDEFGSTLLSDVVTVVDDVADGLQRHRSGHVRGSALKDPGGVDVADDAVARTTSSPSIAIACSYIRADGRNTPGVDVPYRLRRRVHR